jgi:hypothetical protein
MDLKNQSGAASRRTGGVRHLIRSQRWSSDVPHHRPAQRSRKNLWPNIHACALFVQHLRSSHALKNDLGTLLSQCSPSPVIPAAAKLRALPMRRRLRWPRVAAALCLTTVLLLHLAVVDNIATALPQGGRYRRRQGARAATLIEDATGRRRPVRDAVARGGGGGMAVSFNAAAAAAAEVRCKSCERERERNSAGARRLAAAPCAGDDEQHDAVGAGLEPRRGEVGRRQREGIRPCEASAGLGIRRG